MDEFEGFLSFVEWCFVFEFLFWVNGWIVVYSMVLFFLGFKVYLIIIFVIVVFVKCNVVVGRGLLGRGSGIGFVFVICLVFVW